MPYGRISPDAVVIVATVRALKYNGGVKKTDLKEENVDALKKGIVNLEKHIENMKSFGVPVVVAVNRFDTDSEEELNTVIERCHELGAECALSEVFAKGSEGGLDLAEKVISAVENQKADFKPAYDTDMSIKDKINEIVTKIYGGKVLITHRKHKSRLQDLKNSVLIKSLYVWQRRSIHCLTTQNFWADLKILKLR